MKQKARELIYTYVLVLVGSALFALSVDWCMEPNGIAMGGVTGIAQIIHALVPQATVGMIVICLNIPLFLLGWRFLGGHLLVSSLVSMAVSSLLIDGFNLLYDFRPMEDRLLACIFGGVVMGLGFGLVFKVGATTGGTDILARLMKLKLAWLPMGKVLLVVDLTVILLVAAAFRSLETALHGLVALYITTLVMDGVLYGMDNAKVAYIISDHPKELADLILHQLDRSLTFLHGEGGYSGTEKEVILCAFKQKQIAEIKRRVLEVDPNAFMIVTSAHEILGEGFRSYHQNDL